VVGKIGVSPIRREYGEGSKAALALILVQNPRGGEKGLLFGWTDDVYCRFYPTLDCYHPPGWVRGLDPFGEKSRNFFNQVGDRAISSLDDRSSRRGKRSALQTD